LGLLVVFFNRFKDRFQIIVRINRQPFQQSHTDCPWCNSQVNRGGFYSIDAVYAPTYTVYKMKQPTAIKMGQPGLPGRRQAASKNDNHDKMQQYGTVVAFLP